MRVLTTKACLLLTLFTTASLAHDHDHSELNEWMKGLYSSKGSCCSGQDATVLTDKDWETHNGRYRVKIEGEWVDVPPEAVLTDPNRDGRTLVWPYKSTLQWQVRCFMPGAMT